jgi:hypothetical protein
LPIGDRLVLSAPPLRHEDDKARQIVGLCTESIEQPRPHTWAPGDDRTGVHQLVGRIVIDLLTPHRADDAEIIGDTTNVGELLHDLLTRLAEPFELELRPIADQLLPLKLCNLLPARERFRHWLAVHLRQLWLVVEGLELRGSSGLVEEDDPFRLRSVMERIDHSAPAIGGLTGHRFTSEQ